MAERLTSFPTGRAVEDGGLRDEWLDGGVYLLRRGIDYKISDDAFRNRVSLEQARRDIYVKTQKVPEGYVIRAFSPGVRTVAEGEGATEGVRRTVDEAPNRVRRGQRAA